MCKPGDIRDGKGAYSLGRNDHSERKNAISGRNVVNRGNDLILASMKRVDAATFLRMGKQGMPLLDVRAPVEYVHAHLPGALSFPLFEDEERALIGTIYKQKSPGAAVETGMEIVGPKMVGFVREARKLAPNRTLGLYCARGGQRSGGMAWLLDQAGFEVTVLEGGYKALRQYYLEVLADPPVCFRRIGGRTGSRKTEILQLLHSNGQPTIDLEHLAAHRGSAFGSDPDREQPGNEAFENALAMELLRFEPGTCVWVEDESRHIGRKLLPEGVWQAMRQAPLYFIERSFEERLSHILSGYGSLPLEELIEAFQKIRKRMGPQHADAAIRHLREGDLAASAALALQYYDKLYEHQKDSQPAHLLRLIDGIGRSDETIAEQLLLT